MLIPISPAAFQQQAQPEVLFDTHPEVSLDFNHVRERLSHGYDKPFLLIDLNIVRQKARR